MAYVRGPEGIIVSVAQRIGCPAFSSPDLTGDVLLRPRDARANVKSPSSTRMPQEKVDALCQ